MLYIVQFLHLMPYESRLSFGFWPHPSQFAPWFCQCLAILDIFPRKFWNIQWLHQEFYLQFLWIWNQFHPDHIFHEVEWIDWNLFWTNWWNLELKDPPFPLVLLHLAHKLHQFFAVPLFESKKTIKIYKKTDKPFSLQNPRTEKY